MAVSEPQAAGNASKKIPRISPKSVEYAGIRTQGSRSQLRVFVESLPLSLDRVVARWQRRARGERERLPAHLGEPGFGVDEDAGGDVHIAKASGRGADRRVVGRFRGPFLSDHRNLHHQRQDIGGAEGEHWSDRVLREMFHKGWIVIAARASS